MKLRICVLLCSLAVIANLAAKPADVLKSSVKKWLGDGDSNQLQISFNKQKIQFEGCKQKAYELFVSKPFTNNFSLDMSLGYAKGRNSWGVFSQTVLVKNYQITPRWHFEHFSLGLGLSVQQSHRLKTSHGPDINLPLQKQWSIEADLPTFAENHSTRISLVHQQWQSNDVAYSATDYSAKNTALMANYSILF